jgi:antitoxin PrlF
MLKVIKMLATRDLESTLTDRYQTTVPEGVRNALQLSKRDKIHYTIRSSGEVVLTKASPSVEDPILSNFLNFLAKDISLHPGKLQVMNTGLVERIKSLVNGIEFDLDEPLSDDDE